VSGHKCRKKAAPVVNCTSIRDPVGKREFFKENEWLVIVVPSAAYAGERE
jgi:hypothetical protein